MNYLVITNNHAMLTTRSGTLYSIDFISGNPHIRSYSPLPTGKRMAIACSAEDPVKQSLLIPYDDNQRRIFLTYKPCDKLDYRLIDWPYSEHYARCAVWYKELFYIASVREGPTHGMLSHSVVRFSPKDNKFVIVKILAPDAFPLPVLTATSSTILISNARFSRFGHVFSDGIHSTKQLAENIWGYGAGPNDNAILLTTSGSSLNRWHIAPDGNIVKVTRISALPCDRARSIGVLDSGGCVVLDENDCIHWQNDIDGIWKSIVIEDP